MLAWRDPRDCPTRMITGGLMEGCTMKRLMFTEERIIGVLKEAETGAHQGCAKSARAPVPALPTDGGAWTSSMIRWRGAAGSG